MELLVKVNDWEAKFFKPNSDDYFLKGRRKRKGLNYYWELIDVNEKVLAVYSYQWKFFSFSEKFEISFFNQNDYKPFDIILLFKRFPAPYYEIHCDKGHFQIIQHKGLFLSINKNNEQIGLIQEQFFHGGFQKNVKISIEESTDILFHLCLIYGSFLNKNFDSEMFNINFGNIGPELKPLNKDWSPTSI